MDSILRASRPVLWIRAARKDFEDFPEAAQTDFLRALTIVAGGRTPDVAKPLKGLGSGVLELALRRRGDAFRVVYAAQARKGDTAMTDEPIEIVRGSGNVFRDFAHPDADREQLRAILAARIIGVLDERRLSVRDAHAVTGISAADFSRIRRANLGRFTIDRLMTILSRLGQEVEVSVNVHPRAKGSAEPETVHL